MNDDGLVGVPPEMGEQEQQMRRQAEDLKNLISMSSGYNCSNCGNMTFMEVSLIRRISPLVSKTGKPVMLPFPTYVCTQCGNIPADLVPDFLRMKMASESASSTTKNETLSPNPSTDAPSAVETPDSREPISRGNLKLEN